MFLLFCHLQSGGRPLRKSSYLLVLTVNDVDISELFQTLHLKFVVIRYHSDKKVVPFSGEGEEEGGQDDRY